jgi:hypothetical protein
MDGRWYYRPIWGWTWVSYEPWGWLPYHYGRWYNSNSLGWCWIPGPSFGFNFWSPGLVRFYRGSDWVSWVPLGPGDYYNINNYHFNLHNRANLYYLNEVRLMQRRSPDDLVNRSAPGGFRTVNADQFANASITARTQFRAIADPRQAGRIVTDALDVRPTNRSFAPAPDRPVDRPDGKARSVVVRTQPEVASRSDRFVRITTPQAAAPRSRTEQAPVAGSRMQEVPGRNAEAARAYQVSPYRPMPGSSQAVPARPSYGQQGRDTPVMQGQRQENVQRGQQSPAVPSSRRMDSAPPAARPSYSSGGGFSGGSYSGGGFSSGSFNRGGDYSGGAASSSRSVASPSVGGATSGSSSPAAGGASRSTSSAGSAGASSGGSASKKSPEPISYNSAPRSYQTPRSVHKSEPAVARQAVAAQPAGSSARSASSAQAGAGPRSVAPRNPASAPSASPRSKPSQGGDARPSGGRPR